MGFSLFYETKEQFWVNLLISVFFAIPLGFVIVILFRSVFLSLDFGFPDSQFALFVTIASFVSLIIIMISFMVKRPTRLELKFGDDYIHVVYTEPIFVDGKTLYAEDIESWKVSDNVVEIKTQLEPVIFENINRKIVSWTENRLTFDTRFLQNATNGTEQTTVSIVENHLSLLDDIRNQSLQEVEQKHEQEEKIAKIKEDRELRIQKTLQKIDQLLLTVSDYITENQHGSAINLATEMLQLVDTLPETADNKVQLREIISDLLNDQMRKSETKKQEISELKATVLEHITLEEYQEAVKLIEYIMEIGNTLNPDEFDHAGWVKILNRVQPHVDTYANVGSRIKRAQILRDVIYANEPVKIVELAKELDFKPYSDLELFILDLPDESPFKIDEEYIDIVLSSYEYKYIESQIEDFLKSLDTFLKLNVD